ncbi:MAG TPA: hypothetical protein DHV14_13965 [Micrococcales bacterium]|nr:hypothetical protein [Micrococcales bacterium]
MARAANAVVWHLGVLPVYRHHGVGRALLDAYCAHERAAGADHVDVRVAPDDVATLTTFYERCGFEWTEAGFRRLLG